MSEETNRYQWLPSWQRNIIARYPLIYLVPSRERLAHYARFPEEEHPEDFCNLRYGFECNGGWAGLIEELSETGTSLVLALRAFGFQNDASISAGICKAKLGSLRWTGEDNLLPPFHRLWRSYLTDIYHRSGNTCELSGKPGVTRDVGGSWLVTLSDEEYRKERKRRARPGWIRKGPL